MIRTYSNLIKFSTFEERFEYLKIPGSIGIITFGFDRYLNQTFYTSAAWKKIRKQIILRDNACDLGILDRPIYGSIRVHHMNPINVEDVVKRKEHIFNPEFLICVSHNTHNAIHFGNKNNLHVPMKERRKGDTTLWKIS